MKDEAKLVERIRGGDEAAFEALLRPHRAGMLNMAYQITRNLEDAQEVCQDAMIKIFRHLDRFKVGKSFRNWAFKIVANTAYDLLRKRRRRDDLVEGRKHAGIGDGDCPERRYRDLEIRSRLEACLQHLSPRERVVFWMRDGEGHSIKETAELLGSSSISVRTHLSRARKKLRTAFARIDDGGEVTS